MTSRPGTRAAQPGCAQVCAGADLRGTASAIRGWVLLEHPGPWPEDARERAFAELLGPARWELLRTLWEERQLRPLVVRRPGRPSGGEERSVLLASSLPGRQWVERVDADALRDVDLAAVAAGRAGHGEPVAGPLLLVCTHGAVDLCCAVGGRPVAAALAERHPGAVWESSHLGGCHLGANLAVVPHGLMYGRLGPQEAVETVRRVLDGEVPAGSLRGRTPDERAGQWAEAEVRRRLPAARLQDVGVASVRPVGDAHEVRVRAPGGAWSLRVGRRDLPDVPTRCGPVEHATWSTTAITRGDETGDGAGRGPEGGWQDGTGLRDASGAGRSRA